MQQWRPIAGFALIGLVYLIATRIPLPSVDFEISKGTATGLMPNWQALSILAIGLAPLLNALALGEVFRLMPFAPRGAAALRFAFLGRFVLVALALALTAWSGDGVAELLVRRGFVPAADQQHFVLLSVAIFIGTTALLLAIALRYPVPGFRSGIWFLLFILLVFRAPAEFAIDFERLRASGGSPLLLVVGLVYLILAFFFVVVLAGLWSAVGERGDKAEGGEAELSREILVWPIVIAWIWGDPLIRLLAVVAPQLIIGFTGNLQVLQMTISVLLIPLLVFGYFRRMVPKRQRSPLVVAVGVAIALGQMAIVVAGLFLAQVFAVPVPLGGFDIFVLALTMLGLWENLRNGRQPFAGPAEPVPAARDAQV